MSSSSNSINKKKERQVLIDKLAKETRFPNKFAIENVLKIYRAYSSNEGKMERANFQEFLGQKFNMTEEILMDRMYRVFNKTSDGKLSEKEFVCGLSLLFYGTDEEYAEYAYEVYDLNSDAALTRDEMFLLLKSCLPAKQTDEDSEEGVKDLVDQTLKIHDKEQDPTLLGEEFVKGAKLNWLTIELYGPCLPSEECKALFLESVCGPKDRLGHGL